MVSEVHHTQSEINVSAWPFPTRLDKLVDLVCETETDLQSLMGVMMSIMDEEDPRFAEAAKLIARFPAIRKEYQKTQTKPTIVFHVEQNSGTIVGESAHTPVVQVSGDEEGKSTMKTIKDMLTAPTKSLMNKAASTLL